MLGSMIIRVVPNLVNFCGYANNANINYYIVIEN